MGRKKNRAVRNGFSMDALEGRRLLSGAFAGGNDNAIAYDPTSGNLYAAWYDTSSGTLKCNYKDSSGNWHTEQVVDPQSGAGQYVSMALDSNGYPGVAYYYYPTADLRFSRATISGGELNWSSPELADGSGTLSVGKYPSLAFNASSRPAISYYDASHTALRFVSKSGGTTPTWTAVYADGNVNDDVGRYTSLKLNPNTGDWAIAYEMTGTGASESGGALYVERTTSGSTSTWGTPARLAKNRQGGGYTSLQYVNGFPSVSFYDSYDANLMFTRRLSTGSWPASPTAVATNNIQGRYTNLLVQGTSGSQKARIVFQDYNSTSLTGPQTVRVADEPTNWQTDAWDISNRLYTGGGPEIRAARVSDTEFYYTRVGINPADPTLYVSNSVNEGKNYVAKTTTAFSTNGISAHASVVFPEPDANPSNPPIDTMWTFGGHDGTAKTNAVYSSTDGATWTQRTTTGVFSARAYPAAVVRSGTIYVIGGESSTGYLGDMYSSTNGVDWQQVTTTHALPPRSQHTAVVMGSDIYVIGGYGIAADGSGPKLLDEVWKFDGTDWSQVTTSGTRFSPRSGHASYVYNNKLWVVGGYDGAANGARKNDVCSSGDGGSTWTSVTLVSGFPGRDHAGAAVFDNRMWILAGHDSGDFDSVYWSTDGATWTRADALSQFGTRRDLTSVVFKNRLWVIGGIGATGVGQTVYYAKNGEA